MPSYRYPCLGAKGQGSIPFLPFGAPRTTRTGFPSRHLAPAFAPSALGGAAQFNARPNSPPTSIRVHALLRARARTDTELRSGYLFELLIFGLFVGSPIALLQLPSALARVPQFDAVVVVVQIPARRHDGKGP